MADANTEHCAERSFVLSATSECELPDLTARIKAASPVDATYSLLLLQVMTPACFPASCHVGQWVGGLWGWMTHYSVARQEVKHNPCSWYDSQFRPCSLRIARTLLMSSSFRECTLPSAGWFCPTFPHNLCFSELLQL